MSKYLFVSIITLFLLLQSSIVLCATEITGAITAKRGDLVKVEFQPDKSAGPKVGDEVKFSYILSGFPVGAGTGKVTEIDGNSAWIKPEKTNLKLKMDAAIYATGSPAPIEYTIDLPGFEGDAGWHPGGKVTFKFATGLTLDAAGSTYAVKFLGGACFLRPQWTGLLGITKEGYIVRSLQEAHKVRIEQFQSRHLGNGDKVRIVWDRKIQGRSSVFYVTQAIVTRSLGGDPGWFAKIAKFLPNQIYQENIEGGKEFERNQEFLISFVTPKPPPGSRKHTGIMWEMSFIIPDDFDEQYRPEYWEKFFLEIIQSASVVNNP